MGLGSLGKTRANRVMGIDCSTKSLAFACFEGDRPVYCGEVRFKGNDLYQRIESARAETEALIAGPLAEFEKIGYIAFESAVAVNSPRTAIQLAYVYGAVMSVLLKHGAEVVEVVPVKWQTHIGNPLLKAYEKDIIKNKNPGKSVSWYKEAGRKFRKSRTMDFARKYFDIPSDSDNISDAVGIAKYASSVTQR